MGKNPIDRARTRDSRPAREYARVEREQADPITSPKVKAMARVANKEETAKPARTYARVEREQADPITDPKVRAMTRVAHSDEGKSLLTRLRKFLKIDRQSPEA